MMKYFLTTVTCLCFVVQFIGQTATIGYSKDSLQIKAYTEIYYTGSNVDSILVRKIFCDYCNKLQIEFLKDEAFQATYNQRDKKMNIVKDGKSTLAIYLRVNREEFKMLHRE